MFCINQYANSHFKKIKRSHKADNYVFPILNKAIHITPQQIQNRQLRVIKQVNSNMKVIGAALEIETPITTYVARHTYATVLKRSGVSTSIISNALGHGQSKHKQSAIISTIWIEDIKKHNVGIKLWLCNCSYQ
jgi:site-specific recombinase XerD